MPRGLLIVLEGGEGSGKSTQAKCLFRHLSRERHPALLTHEPGGTPLGNSLRRLLKGRHRPTHWAELFLFLAARAELVEKVLRPALADGRVVVCDRYYPSTLAYQVAGRQMDAGLVEMANDLAIQGVEPALVVLLDIAAEAGLTRKARSRPDRFEEEGLAFHRRVRKGYLAQARAEPERWLVLDAALPKEKLEDIIWQRVKELLSSR